MLADMPTQQALYADLAERSFDPELSWAEHELPERLRTKHVHRLHPYLGKFVPQLVERFLDRHFRPGQSTSDTGLASASHGLRGPGDVEREQATSRRLDAAISVSSRRTSTSSSRWRASRSRVLGQRHKTKAAENSKAPGSMRSKS